VYVAIGAPGYTAESHVAPQSGAIFILYGRHSANLIHNVTFTRQAFNIVEIEKVASVVIYGDPQEPGSRFGSSMAVVDLNKDGLDDLVVSAPQHNAVDLFYDGQVYIFFGNSQIFDVNFTSETACAPDIASIIIKAPQKSPMHKPYPDEPYNFQNTLLGMVLNSADIDGDGHQDLLIGSPLAETYKGFPQRGAVHAFLSSDVKLKLQDRLENASTPMVLDVDVHSSWALDPHDFVSYQWFGQSIAFSPHFGSVGQTEDSITLEGGIKKPQMMKQAKGGTLVIGAPNWRTWADTETKAVGRVYIYEIKYDDVDAMVGKNIRRPELKHIIEGSAKLGSFGK
jgi:hypothetical protein